MTSSYQWQLNNSGIHCIWTYDFVSVSWFTK